MQSKILFILLHSLQVYDTATTCTKQAADSFLDGWISNAVQLVAHQLLQTLKELLGG